MLALYVMLNTTRPPHESRQDLCEGSADNAQHEIRVPTEVQGRLAAFPHVNGPRVACVPSIEKWGVLSRPMTAGTPNTRAEKNVLGDRISSVALCL